MFEDLFSFVISALIKRCFLKKQKLITLLESSSQS